MTLFFFLGTLKSDDKSRTARPIYFHVFFSLRLMLRVKYVIKAREFIYSFDIKLNLEVRLRLAWANIPFVLIQAISSALDAAHSGRVYMGRATIGTKQWMRAQTKGRATHSVPGPYRRRRSGGTPGSVPGLRLPRAGRDRFPPGKCIFLLRYG